MFYQINVLVHNYNFKMIVKVILNVHGIIIHVVVFYVVISQNKMFVFKIYIVNGLNRDVQILEHVLICMEKIKKNV